MLYEDKTKGELIRELETLVLDHERLKISCHEELKARELETGQLRKELEALSGNESEYRRLFESMAQGVVYQDLNGHIIKANPAAERLLGLTFDQMQGRTSIDPRWKAINEDGSDFPGNDHPAMVALATGKSVLNVVMGIFHPVRNDYVYLLVNAEPEFLPGETIPYRVFATFSDVTESKLREKEIKEIHQRTLTIMDSIDSFIYIADIQTHELLFVNEYGKNTWGSNPVGSKCHVTLQGLGAPCAFCTNGKLLDADGNPTGVYHWEFKNLITGRWYDIRDRAIRWTDGRMVRMEIATDITELKEKEETIREREERLQNLVNSQTNYVIRTDMEGKLTYRNRKFDADFGWTHDHHGETGDNAMLSICDYHHQRTIQTVEECIKNPGKIVKVELDKPARDGEIRTTLWEFVCLTDANNNPAEIQCMGIDITEKTKAEKALVKNEQRLSEIAENSQTLIWETDTTGTFIYVSPVSEKLLGWKPVDMTGRMNFRDIITGNKREEFFRTSDALLIFNAAVYQAKRANEELIWVEINGKPVFSENGQFKGYIGGINDITSRKLAELELLKFRTISDQANYATAIVNLEGECLYLNDAMARIHGGCKEDFLGRNLTKFHNQDQLPEVMKLLDIIRTQGGFAAEEVWHARLDGSVFPTLMNASLILDENGQPAYLSATAIDISDKKQTEQKIRDLNANLEKKIAERTEELAQINQNLLNEILVRSQIEKALAEEKRRLDDIIHSTDTGTWEWNIATGELTFNERWAAMVGYTIDELSPTTIETWKTLLHPDDKILTEKLLQDHFRGESEYYEAEIRMHHKNGDWIWIATRGRVHQWDEPGKPLFMSGIHQEITQRKKIEAFEKELLSLSVKITGAAFEEINQTIILALQRIGEFLLTDRVYVAEFSDQDKMGITYEWVHPDYPPIRPLMTGIPCSMYPEWSKTIRNSETINIPDINELPESWNREKELMLKMQLKSVVALPLRLEDQVIGFTVLDNLTECRVYTDFEINALTILSNLLVSLIMRKRSEELMERIRINYKTFFDTIDDYLFVLDLDGKILFNNETVVRRLGYASQELTGQSVLMIHPEDRRAEAHRIMGEIIEGKADHCPVPVIRKDGTLVPVETRVKHGFWDDKPVIFGVVKDLSALTLSEEKFSKAFQTSAALMGIIRFSDGIYIDVNNTFLSSMGFDRPEVIGKTVDELGIFCELSSNEWMTRCLHDQKPIRDVEMDTCTKSGRKITVLFSADIIYVGQELCILTMMIDITHRKTFEKELTKAKNEAEKANLAKSEFLSRMSHEFRTPMNSILGFAQLLEMSELNDRQKKGIQYIMRSGRHLLDLINEVLDIARIESGRLSLSIEPVEVMPVLQDMMDIIQPMARERQVSVRFNEISRDRLFVDADRQRLKQVLLNLMDNGIKYNRQGGSLVISAETVTKGDPQKDFIHISIADTGIGISAEDITKVFIPFERIGADKTETEGTGLGLAVVRKLLEAMGGSVEMESTPGIGTTLHVFLHKASNRNSTISNPETSGLPASENMQKGKILYIEDNPSNLELVEQILHTHRPHITLMAEKNGTKGLASAFENKPDLILLDLNLPDSHGSDVISQLKQNELTKEIPVVIISADAMPHQIRRMISAGAVHYLAKPLDIRDFLDVMDKYIPEKAV